MQSETDGPKSFDIGWCPERKTVTVEYKCCDHEDPGMELIHLTPEKAIFLANLLLEKVLAVYWTQEEKK